MQTKVQKWGNSLALRIPHSFAVDARLKRDTLVDISLVDGKLVIKPVSKRSWRLETLLEKISAENIHREIDTGKPQGKEVW